MHYLLAYISKQMSLNKIIFFLLLVMPEGQTKGTEHLPGNVQCTQTMTSGSSSLCQSWVLGHWEICSSLCLSESGSVFLCSGLSHVSAFQTLPFQPCTPSDVKDHLFLADLCGKRVQVSRDGLAGSKIFPEIRQDNGGHSSAIIQV